MTTVRTPHVSRTQYTFSEELLHSITHGVGAVLSVAGLAVLVGFAALSGDPYRVVSVSIFGASLILLYTASTIYHAVQGPLPKRIWRIVDHSTIFLLIAGTYTPFVLVTLRGPMGWTLFGIIWALAIAGIVLKIFFTGRFGIASTFVYLGMGWLGVIAFKPAFVALQVNGLLWLVAGGLAYTIGVVFYAWKQLPFNHAIWHLFTLAGSACHYFCVLFFVVL